MPYQCNRMCAFAALPRSCRRLACGIRNCCATSAQCYFCGALSTHSACHSAVVWAFGCSKRSCLRTRPLLSSQSPQARAGSCLVECKVESTFPVALNCNGECVTAVTATGTFAASDLATDCVSARVGNQRSLDQHSSTQLSPLATDGVITEHFARRRNAANLPRFARRLQQRSSAKNVCRVR